MTATPKFDLAGKRVFVAGHRGMVGAALVRRLASENCTVLTVPKTEVDLTRQDTVEKYLAAQKPDAVFLAAARVGGIHANNSRPAEFLFENLAIQNAVIDGAYKAGVRKLLFLGSTCIYPRMAPQPMHEDALLTGPLEPTNEWYAVAKIAGLKMCQAYQKQYGVDFIACMPTNLYGPGDNFDLQTSHVLPALIRRLHEAKESGAPSVTLWGTGSPRREFLHVDDLAAACLRLLDVYDEAEHVNVGVGEDVTIAELASLIADVVGYEGELEWDSSKPDGTPRKLLDVQRMNSLGWEPAIGLREGIASTYEEYRATAP
jgi:GDP-L-fucose synthase